MALSDFLLIFLRISHGNQLTLQTESFSNLNMVHPTSFSSLTTIGSSQKTNGPQMTFFMTVKKTSRTTAPTGNMRKLLHAVIISGNLMTLPYKMIIGTVDCPGLDELRTSVFGTCVENHPCMWMSKGDAFFNNHIIFIG